MFLDLRDPVSAVTHGLACVASVVVTCRFWQLERGFRSKQLAFLVFGVCMTLLYGASTIYHSLLLPEGHLEVYRRIDHSAIYLLIAGTNTPITFILIPSAATRAVFLVPIWLFAFAGIVCKWVFPNLPDLYVALPYIALGWIGGAAYLHLKRAVGVRAMMWVVYGGVAYTLGAILDWQKWPSVYAGVFGPHETFHLMVILGSFCHVWFMLKYVVAHRP